MNENIIVILRRKLKQFGFYGIRHVAGVVIFRVFIVQLPGKDIAGSQANGRHAFGKERRMIGTPVLKPVMEFVLRFLIQSTVNEAFKALTGPPKKPLKNLKAAANEALDCIRDELPIPEKQDLRDYREVVIGQLEDALAAV